MIFLISYTRDILCIAICYVYVFSALHFLRPYALAARALLPVCALAVAVITGVLVYALVYNINHHENHVTCHTNEEADTLFPPPTTFNSFLSTPTISQINATFKLRETTNSGDANSDGGDGKNDDHVTCGDISFILMSGFNLLVATALVIVTGILVYHMSDMNISENFRQRKKVQLWVRTLAKIMLMCTMHRRLVSPLSSRLTFLSALSTTIISRCTSFLILSSLFRSILFWVGM